MGCHSESGGKPGEEPALPAPVLRSLLFRFAAVFGALPRFRKIGVGILQHGVLVAMTKLILHSHVPRILVILSFRGALRRILIARVMCHDSTS